MSLEGKVALVTGGGSGIGAAVAARFVQKGAKVCITGRRQALLDEVASSLPSSAVTTCTGDVSRHEDVVRMVASALEFWGKLDILVNNAGIGAPGSVTEIDLEMWTHVLDVNLTGPFLLMRQAIPHMIDAGGGSIVNIASLAGVRCLSNAAAYSVSKAGLIMLTKQAALDYGPRNIRCNALLPGPVRTPMLDKDLSEDCEALGLDVDAYVERLAPAVPLRRSGFPHEVAAACEFLADDSSSFITGVALLIDGGISIIDAFGAAVENSHNTEGV
jgi:meso-butanediol dehydrogenase / (S,S)-butanediol dehydrogenase / diacetyl reductase